VRSPLFPFSAPFMPARSGRDIAPDATVRSAALRQQHRRGLSVRVKPSDLHAKVRERRVGNLLAFVIDCNGFMGAERRLLATQGATLSLLVDAYQRRDRLGLVTFREQSATVVLRPTASIELARTAFQSLGTGEHDPPVPGAPHRLRADRVRAPPGTEADPRAGPHH